MSVKSLILLILLSESSVARAAGRNASCSPSAIVTFQNLTSGRNRCGSAWEIYAPTYTVTTEDCTRCQGRLTFYGAKVAPNVSWSVTSRPVTIAPGEDFEFNQLIRQRLLARTDVPQWFAAWIRDFYDQFAGPLAPISCNLINDSSSQPMYTDQSVALVDLKTMRLIPWSSGCPIIAKRSWNIAGFFIYFAFFDYSSMGFQILDSRGVFSDELSDRIHRATTLFSAYCTPLTICMLLFALNVVRKSLDVTDSHVFHYHKVLAHADILIAFFVFLKETQFIGFLVAPFCYAAPEAFKIYNNNLPQSYIGKGQDRQLFVAFPIISVICFTSIIQALLSLDRFNALFCPIFYLRISNTPTVRKLISVAAVVTLITVAADLATDAEFRCITNPEYAGCGAVSIASGMNAYGKLLRVCLLAVSSLMQLVCCSCIFVKMALRLRMPQHSQGGSSTSRKLVPFYLLLGTCGLGLVSASMDALYYITDFDVLMHRNLPPSAWYLSSDLTLFFAGFLPRLRIPIMSVCSSSGLLLHLLVSSHCRAAAWHGLVTGIGKLKRLCLKALALLSALLSYPRESAKSAIVVPATGHSLSISNQQAPHQMAGQSGVELQCLDSSAPAVGNAEV